MVACGSHDRVRVSQLSSMGRRSTSVSTCEMHCVVPECPMFSTLDREQVTRVQLRYDSFMPLLRILALLLTTGALLDHASAAGAPDSSTSPGQAANSRAVMTGEQVVQILDETV